MRKRRLWHYGGVAALLAAGLFSAGGGPTASVAAGLLNAGGGPTASVAAADPCAVTIHKLPGSFGEGLADVVAVAPDDVWAVGDGGSYRNPYGGSHAAAPRILHWGGTDWTEAPLPARVTAPAEGTLRAVTAFGPDDVWAVGNLLGAGDPPPVHPLALHWDGAAWQVVDIPDSPPGAATTPAGSLVAVDGTSAHDLWAVGASILHYDGTSWQTAAVPDTGSGPLTFQSLAVLAPDNVWVVAAPQAAGNPAGPTVLLHWDGRAWSAAEGLPAGFQPTAVGGVRGQAGLWAVGNGAAHWDGARWTAVPVPGLRAGAFQSVTVAASGEAWAVARRPTGPYDSLLSGLVHWDGRRWEQFTDSTGVLPNPYTDLDHIGIAGPGDIWVVGSTTTPGGSGGSWADANILHLFSPCGLPTAPVADPHAAGVAYFPQVKHTLRGRFRAYWESHGGLAQFGYPLTEEYAEKSATDGKPYTVQYFQRARFEAHPENAGTPYEVLLGLLGRTVTTSRQAGGDAAFLPLAEPPAGRLFFPATGHAVAAEFAAYWQAHGGLAVYGYPISEPLRETSPADDKEYLTQYFERNRLEFHPELPEAFRVSLGLLGVDVLRARAWLP